MVPNGWQETNIGSHLLNSKLRNKDGIFSHDDLRAVNKRHGMIPMKDRVKGKSVDRAKLVKKDWFAYNPMRINIGSICRWEHETDCIVSPDYVVFHCNPQTLDTDYFDQFRRSHKWNKFMEDAGRGSVRIRIYLETLKQLKCTLPLIEEQKTIAAILKTWDQAIQATEKLIENSERQKKAIMQQLLTGKKRLKGFSGEWVETKIGEVAKIKKGRALSKRHLTAGNYPVIAGGKSSPYSHGDFTHENVITVSASGAYAGYVAYHPKKIWASDCSVVEGKESIRTKYAFELLRLNQQQLYRLQTGGAQPHIYTKNIEGIKIALPPIDEQDAILSVLGNSRDTVRRYKANEIRLSREKAALMQQLLTGKRRVKIVEEIAS